jgi:hypothetical protein
VRRPCTNALPFAAPAVFAGAICVDVSELVQITVAATVAVIFLKFMRRRSFLIVCTGIANKNPGSTDLFLRPQPARMNFSDERIWRRRRVTGSIDGLNW